MRLSTAAAVIVLALALALGACATRATKAFSVSVSSYSIEYTPGQIHDYLRSRGFQRVQFEDWDSGIKVYEKRNAAMNEQHFRLKSYPKLEVIVRLEKIRHGFGDTGPRVIVWFRDDDSSNFSPIAQEEYDRLIEEVTNLVGPDRIEIWDS